MCAFSWLFKKYNLFINAQNELYKTYLFLAGITNFWNLGIYVPFLAGISCYSNTITYVESTVEGTGKVAFVHVMKAYRRHSSTHLNLSTRWRSVVSPNTAHFTPWETAPSTHWIEGCLGLRISLDVFAPAGIQITDHIPSLYQLSYPSPWLPRLSINLPTYRSCPSKISNVMFDYSSYHFRNGQC